MYQVKKVKSQSCSSPVWCMAGPLSLPLSKGSREKPHKTCNLHLCRILILSSDVETNPGPSISMTSHNISGMKYIDKCRRILNNAYKAMISELSVIVLQETHTKRLLHQWRLRAIRAPSEGNTKGTLLLYNESNFDTINHTDKDLRGRWATLIATKCKMTHLFCSIYGPNHKHLNFYNSFINMINTLIINHQVDSINKANNRAAGDKRNAIALFNMLMNNRLSILYDPTQHN